jgi:hypothetical protein
MCDDRRHGVAEVADPGPFSRSARNCFGSCRLNHPNTRKERCCHAPSDISRRSRSRHFDLIGGGGHPWSIDLVAETAAGILVVGFACACSPGVH